MSRSKRTADPRLKYTDYRSVTLLFEFSQPSLGGFPADQTPYWDAKRPPLSSYFDQILHRNAEGHAIISRGQLRGLVREAARLMGTSPALKDYVFVEDSVITVNNAGTAIILSQPQQVCIPVNAGAVGRGLVRHEAAPIHSTITVNFSVPTSVVSVDQFAEAIRIAGRTIGLGAQRKLGFGSFLVSKMNEGANRPNGNKKLRVARSG